MFSSVLKSAALACLALFMSLGAAADDYEYAVEAYSAGDYAEALPIFLELAEGGNDDAMWYLGKMYDYGRGVEQSDSQAFNWFKKSADLGDSDSMYEVAVFYHNGQGMDADQEAAFKWYLKSAKSGHVKAMTQVGIRYEDGNGVRASAKKAFEWFKKASEGGDAEGQAFLGFAYEFGEGTRASEEKAVYWYNKSAEQGDDLGLAYLASMYESGTGVPLDRNRAIELYRLSAEQGNEYAQSQLEEMGGTHAISQAPASSSVVSAEASDARSSHTPANTTEENCNYDLDVADMKPDCQYGVALRMVQDLEAYDSALPILSRLSDAHQHVDANYLLGVMYDQGQGWAKVSKPVAFDYYLKAANGGHPEAQAVVGGAYLVGEMGQAKDQSTGLDFIKRAARQGHQRSKDFLTSQNIEW